MGKCSFENRSNELRQKFPWAQGVADNTSVVKCILDGRLISISNGITEMFDVERGFSLPLRGFSEMKLVEDRYKNRMSSTTYDFFRHIRSFFPTMISKSLVPLLNSLNQR